MVLRAGLPTSGGAKKKDPVRLGDIDDATDDFTENVFGACCFTSAGDCRIFPSAAHDVNWGGCGQSGQEFSIQLLENKVCLRTR
jgi:hypothetical protein